ncbi:MAG: hypothetical protein ACK417_04685 [Bacteroidia bacterium]
MKKFILVILAYLGTAISAYAQFEPCGAPSPSSSLLKYIESLDFDSLRAEQSNVLNIPVPFM